MTFISPGATIGVLGGGQLGRMLAFEARRSGYKIVALDPSEDCPISKIADKTIIAAFDDRAAAFDLAKMSDVVTYEFENIDIDVVKDMEKQGVKIFPGSAILEVSQHRFLEKTFFKENNIPVCDFASVVSADDLDRASEAVGFPAFLKTCRFGYDGKGQILVKDKEEALKAFEEMGGQDLIWEKLVDFNMEISVICVRGSNGEIVTYPIPENIHEDKILDISVVPARIDNATKEVALEIARSLAEKLSVVGTFCVELFVLPDGSVVVNEIAPRPHNSGHYTFDACKVSQFENQMRAICGLPLGSTDLLSPVVMVNILGDGKGDSLGGVDKLFSDPDVRLHLYEKKDSKPKRKMGHFTVMSDTVDNALEKAMKVRNELFWTNNI